MLKFILFTFPVMLLFTSTHLCDFKGSNDCMRLDQSLRSKLHSLQYCTSNINNGFGNPTQTATVLLCSFVYCISARNVTVLHISSKSFGCLIYMVLLNDVFYEKEDWKSA